MASAKRGFLRGASVAAVASVFVVIRSVQVIVQRKDDGVPLAFSKVFFIEDWFGHHVFLTGPVAQVPFPAALAAKREVRVDRRVRLRFADGAFVLHCALFPLCELCALCVLCVERLYKEVTEITRAKETLSSEEEYSSAQDAEGRPGGDAMKLFSSRNFRHRRSYLASSFGG